MIAARHAPPLPQPPGPATAARAIAEAAADAALAWAQPLGFAAHDRAVSQLYSALRDLGIATRALAAWQPAGAPPGTTSAELARHVTSAARWLRTAWSSLEGVLAFEGLGQLPDPDEPGTALCHAARDTILTWRQPTGSSLDRDTAIRQLITATGQLSAATASLATHAPRRRAIALQAAGASLTEATADLTAAIQPGQDEGPTEPGRGQ